VANKDNTAARTAFIARLPEFRRARSLAAP
jgi:hypothetical protein